MKKIMTMSLFFLLVTAACSNAPADENNGAANHNNDQQQTVTNHEDDNDNEDDLDSAEPEEEKSADETVKNDENNDGTNSDNQSSEDHEGDTENKQSEEDELHQLGLDIFTAQKDEDYEYLKSILADSASMDEDENMFYFDDIEYPHELEFVQEDADNLEYRFIHEEDDGMITVGFGIVDKETESSYTIDYQFIEEDGEWKMKDMDRNA